METISYTSKKQPLQKRFYTLQWDSTGTLAYVNAAQLKRKSFKSLFIDKTRDPYSISKHDFGSWAFDRINTDFRRGIHYSVAFNDPTFYPSPILLIVNNQ